MHHLNPSVLSCSIWAYDFLICLYIICFSSNMLHSGTFTYLSTTYTPNDTYVLRIFNVIAYFNSFNYLCSVIDATFVRLMTSIKLIRLLHKNVFLLLYHTWRTICLRSFIISFIKIELISKWQLHVVCSFVYRC